MQITMIGHSTVSCELGGMVFLFDPYFSLHGNAAYQRIAPPAKTREQMRNVDAVLISHNHFDHVDGHYLRSLAATVPVFCPSITAWITRWKGAQTPTGIKPWSQVNLGSVRVTAVPAKHSAPSVGYLLEHNGRRLYFSGDTYYGDFMKRIGAELHPDVALMPVTTFRTPTTMGTAGALRAAQALTPKIIIPIHLGLQARLPFLRSAQTVQEFSRQLEDVQPATRVISLRNGEQWTDSVEESPSAAAQP